MFCRSYDYIVLDMKNLCRVLCFPSFDDICCRDRFRELVRLGITSIYSFGEILLWNGVHVVGKGHSAVVVLAHHVEYGDIALKIRRIDSKSISLEYEGFILRKARISFAPKVYMYSRDFLLREFVDGCTLEKFLEVYSHQPKVILKGFEYILRGALELDLIGIDLVEISRPHKQIIYRCCNSSEPLFIDFESAKISPRPLNITKVINFLIKGSIENHRIRDILRLNDDKVTRILELAKQYKKTIDRELRKRLVEEIVEILNK